MTTSYLAPFFNIAVFPEVVEKVGEAVLKDYKECKFEALVCTGLSGTIIASAISYKYHIPFIIIRKDKSSHSFTDIEGDYEKYKRFAIIDDLISTGKTLKTIKSKLDDVTIKKNYRTVVHVYLYASEKINENGVVTLRNLNLDPDYDVTSFNFMFAAHEEY